MPAFQFRTVPHLIIEAGAAAQLGAHIAHQFPTVRRALLVTDAGFLRTGLADAPLHSLRTAGIDVRVFSEVQADPPEAIVLAGVAQARMFHVELVIGLGGGSSLDVAKLVAVLAPGHQDLAQLYGIGNVNGQRLPLVQLPTTAGTGRYCASQRSRAISWAMSAAAAPPPCFRYRSGPPSRPCRR